jgi:cell cycle arrest protein BUB2
MLLKTFHFSPSIDGYEYVGMNVLLAPLLYVMESEVEAFFCLHALVSQLCPRYVGGNLEGVHEACDLLSLCLAALDAEMHEHLKAIGLETKLFAFPALMTLLASMQPLDEVLIAWDFLLVAGPHFAVLLFANHIVLMRETLLRLNSAFK